MDGEWRFDSKRGAMIWTIDLIDDTNRSGSMEFVVSAADPDSFYPVEVGFWSGSGNQAWAGGNRGLHVDDYEKGCLSSCDCRAGCCPSFCSAPSRRLHVWLLLAWDAPISAF